MPKTIVIGHMADGTELTTTVKTAAEYFYGGAGWKPAHPDDIAGVTTTALEERWSELNDWATAQRPGAADPRCGCSADNEGGNCYWDDTRQIDDELDRRNA